MPYCRRITSKSSQVIDDHDATCDLLMKPVATTGNPLLGGYTCLYMDGYAILYPTKTTAVIHIHNCYTIQWMVTKPCTTIYSVS